ncbi:hypothetical protein B0T14DRAFT_523399 [Immersiella caudata]|uniref:Uncharacterized protein n=1 Tax=Immersiella caudata TaxID=314043 RepID=A0AA40BWV2_9PEZI|nr:hypothetical protein B0T14DRAFT_523399 [Immersiella caudata]
MVLSASLGVVRRWRPRLSIVRHPSIAHEGRHSAHGHDAAPSACVSHATLHAADGREQ